ncbi:hypothetical protein BAUCODRAFT_530240 [Baudoinia panamericana UAMH 10762]|uniref:Uncharacterized protein n=1 Tax=Baudoinia panamericana (strain UAMH 10762) TaxID=717646 RepID=M2N7Z0_BAUPA|nr:uncharacterized protein BAUCODRAFT_530240 [Baudoinia panamericana UAMH 10762]EMC95204.1 hypothetical protein BAUCODRAFT_530240 [Baudoinia panamericana UAMH 10762]
MCFQGFVYFACGHSRIVYNDCAVATTTGLPYFNRTLCPNYTIDHQQAPNPCGLGGFYCSHDQAGTLFDQYYAQFRAAENSLRNADMVLANIRSKVPRLRQEVQRSGMTPKQLRAHHSVITFTNQLNRSTQQQAAALRAIAAAQKILLQGIAYYQLRAQWVQNGGNPANFLPFVPSVEYGQVPTQPRDRMYLPGTQAPAAPNLIASENTSSQPTQQALIPITRYPLSPDRSDELAAPTYNTPILPNPYPVPASFPPSSGDPPPMQPPVLPANRDGRRRKARTPAPLRKDSVIELEDSVRRSTRVRGKRVSYAESSDSASREASPIKSDITGFTPERSEASSSPPKKGRPRKKAKMEEVMDPFTLSTSLGQKMADWSKRGGGPTKTPSPLAHGPLFGLGELSQVTSLRTQGPSLGEVAVSLRARRSADFKA